MIIVAGRKQADKNPIIEISEVLIWQKWLSVFPTRVGVTPRLPSVYQTLSGVPHMCGGDPVTVSSRLKDKYSLRMWGNFFQKRKVSSLEY